MKISKELAIKNYNEILAEIYRMDENESLEICKMLAEAGIDSIEVSGNGTSVGGIKAGINEGYFGDFAAKLASEVEIPIICVGGWRSC